MTEKIAWAMTNCGSIDADGSMRSGSIIISYHIVSHITLYHTYITLYHSLTHSLTHSGRTVVSSLSPEEEEEATLFY